MLLAKYGEVDYERYAYYNNLNKGFAKFSFNPNFKVHIDEIVKVDENNPIKDMVKLSNSQVKSCLVSELISATLAEEVKATNPSILKEWRGWKYTPIRTIKVQKIENAKTHTFKPFVNLQPNYKEVLIPPFLQNQVKVEFDKNYYHIDRGDYSFWANITIKNLNGEQKIECKLVTDGGDIDEVTVYGDINKARIYKNIVLSWEEIDVSKVGSLARNLPQASDGKYYHVWWDSDTSDTDKHFAELVTDAYPSRIDEEHQQFWQRYNGYWLFRDIIDKSTHIALTYKGFWVEKSKNEAKFVNVNTPEIDDYIVLNHNDEKLCTLKEYYNYAIKNLANLGYI